jgi:hypothetical protein
MEPGGSHRPGYALVTRPGRPTPTRRAGRAATQHPSAADDQGVDPGPARRNSGQATRWHQAASASPEREPRSGPHNPQRGCSHHSSACNATTAGAWRSCGRLRTPPRPCAWIGYEHERAASCLTLALAAVEAVRNPSLRWWLQIYVARDASCVVRRVAKPCSAVSLPNPSGSPRTVLPECWRSAASRSGPLPCPGDPARSRPVQAGVD